MFCVDWKTENSTSVHSMRMESPLNQRLRWSPPDVVYTPIDVTSFHRPIHNSKMVLSTVNLGPPSETRTPRKDRCAKDHNAPSQHLEDGSTYYPLRSTRLDEIKNFHLEVPVGPVAALPCRMRERVYHSAIALGVPIA